MAKKGSKSKSSKSPAADSMANAAAILHLPIAALAWAKSERCKAFRGSRIYLKEFEAWWDLNSERFEDRTDLPSKDVLDREIKQQKLEREKRDDEIDKKKWLPAKETIEAVRTLASNQRAVLQSRLENELPQKLVGRDVIFIRQCLAGVVDELCAIFSSEVAKWPVPERDWFYEI